MMKASKFGPDENSGLFSFKRAYYHQNASYRKMNKIKIVEKL